MVVAPQETTSFSRENVVTGVRLYVLPLNPTFSRKPRIKGECAANLRASRRSAPRCTLLHLRVTQRITQIRIRVNPSHPRRCRAATSEKIRALKFLPHLTIWSFLNLTVFGDGATTRLDCAPETFLNSPAFAAGSGRGRPSSHVLAVGEGCPHHSQYSPNSHHSHHSHHSRDSHLGGKRWGQRAEMTRLLAWSMAEASSEAR